MNTITVWLLISAASGWSTGVAPAQSVASLASEQECKRLATAVNQMRSGLVSSQFSAPRVFCEKAKIVVYVK